MNGLSSVVNKAKKRPLKSWFAGGKHDFSITSGV